jgi:hypothetical protein
LAVTISDPAWLLIVIVQDCSNSPLLYTLGSEQVTGEPLAVKATKPTSWLPETATLKYANWPATTLTGASKKPVVVGFEARATFCWKVPDVLGSDPASPL